MRIKFDTKGFDKVIDKTKKELDRLTVDAHKFFVAETPIRSGNARRNTGVVGNKIIANYPYAQRLDEGWSNQSPDGMTNPTTEHIEQVLVPRALRRINGGK
jgi:hypothetical protein